MSRGPFLLRDGGVGFDGIAVTHSGVDPHACTRSEGVVVVHEAAFGGFDVQGGETVGDGAEAQRVRAGLEGLSVESDYCWGGEGLVFWWVGGGLEVDFAFFSRMQGIRRRTESVPTALYRNGLSGKKCGFGFPESEVWIKVRYENVAVGVSRGEIVICARGVSAGRTANVTPRWIHEIQSARGGIIAVSCVEQGQCILSLHE